ncbi:hypothetical protein L209DRAFT_3973 [Thermothelomyces heterothallicus CBS 203.75]
MHTQSCTDYLHPIRANTSTCCADNSPRCAGTDTASFLHAPPPSPVWATPYLGTCRDPISLSTSGVYWAAPVARSRASSHLAARISFRTSQALRDRGTAARFAAPILVVRSLGPIHVSVANSPPNHPGGFRKPHHTATRAAHLPAGRPHLTRAVRQHESREDRMRGAVTPLPHLSAFQIG